jgi:transposase
MASRYFIGVDLHQSVVQVCVLDAKGEVVSERRFRGESLEDGLKVVGFVVGHPHCRVAVEAIGMNRWFVNALQAKKCDVVVVDPVKLNLKASGKKTDRRDAYEIARRLHLGDIDRNAKSYYPNEQEYGHRKLTRLRRSFVDIRQQLVNNIRAILRAFRIPQPKSPLYFKKSLRALREVTGLSENLAFCLKHLIDELEHTQAAIAQLKRRIEAEAEASAEVAALIDTLPQVGPQTALTLVCELGDVKRFRSVRAVASYAGIVPRVMNSADTAHHGAITKRGNRELRWVVAEWAVRLLSTDNVVQAWASPRLKRMHRNKVRTALARRLLVGVYITMRRGEVFSLDRCLAA